MERNTIKPDQTRVDVFTSAVFPESFLVRSPPCQMPPRPTCYCVYPDIRYRAAPQCPTPLASFDPTSLEMGAKTHKYNKDTAMMIFLDGTKL